MEIVTKQTAVLIPYVNNARTHSTEQIKQIAASIKEFGFTNPILLDGDNGIIAGHGRVMAAELLKMAEVPCIELPHLTPAQKKAYILADNKLALNAGWDDELLEAELKSLEELDFDVDLTGFDSDELSDIFRDGEAVEDDFDVDAEIEAIETPVTKLGDIWKLGNHRLMCGDSTDKETVAKLMEGNKADMVFTDPPYGMDLDTDFSKMTSAKSEKFSKGLKGGNYEQGVVDSFEPKMIESIIKIDAKETFIWGADYFAELLPNRNQGSWVVWDKRANLSGVIEDDYSSDKIYGSTFELCWSKERHKRDMARVKWAGIFGMSGEDTKSRAHPTQKPIKLCEWFLTRYSKEKEIIIDLFGGSGSTLIACEQLNRSCYMMELDEKYCDVIIKRWETLTGKQAEVIQNGTKQTAGEVL